MMVDDHKKDIDAFKKAESNVDDNDFKNFYHQFITHIAKTFRCYSIYKIKNVGRKL